jgi:hypothetical protein
MPVTITINSTAGKTTVAMNSQTFKTCWRLFTTATVEKINCGNLIDAICRAFIERRNKDKILELAKSSRNLI